MAKLTTTITQGFTKEGSNTTGEGSILVEQVEGTSCDNILIDIFIGSRVGTVKQGSTLGSLVYSGAAVKEVTERITFSGTSSSTLTNPGVTKVHSFNVIGKVKLSDDTGDYKGREPPSTHFVYDSDETTIHTSHKQNVYAVLEVSYRIVGKRYKFKWPSTDEELYAMVYAEGKNGFPKSSTTIDRVNCELNEEEQQAGAFAANSGDTQQIYDLKLDFAFSAAELLSSSLARLGALIYVYPFPDAKSPEFNLLIDNLEEQELEWEIQQSVKKTIDEVLVFNGNGISNLSIFPTSPTALTLTTLGVIYDSSGSSIQPSFRKPGDQVLLSNAQGFTTGTQRLGPTEVGIVTTGNILVPAIGSVRAQYTVPMKAIRITSSVPMTRDRFQKWQAKLTGTLLHTISTSDKPVFFRGESSIGNPFGRVQPAKDQLTQNLMDQFLP